MMADSGDRVEDHAEAFDQPQRLPQAQAQDNDIGGGAVEPKGITNDMAHLDPSRWWFASSAFPMIAGTLGPVASAFSICALVRPWRQNFVPGSDIAQAPFIDDPIWLTVINAIQLAVAVIANIILLLNMARKIRFVVAQPITIVTWYISSICLLALCSTAAGPLVKEPQAQYIWSGAFYYGIYAAVLYFICSSLMVVTFWGAITGHYDKDFQLTNSQRTLMLQTIMFLVYLLLGALVFSTVEGWPFLDTVYWADVTLFTVGFGDYAAATPLGRGLLFPYALIGVISLGLVVGSIRSLILERGRRQLSARMLEKNRKRMLRRMVRRGKDHVLTPVTDDDIDDDEPNHLTTTTTGMTELARRQKEFELMRRIQAQSERRRRWMAMGLSTTVWLVLWLVGAVVFQQCEATYQGWTYFQGFYFAFVSLTTIGYGDVTPISPAGKSFFVFWSLLALPTMTVLISNAGDTVVKLVREGTDWLGTVTVLPGDRGVKKEMKVVVQALSFGRVFSEDSDVEEEPPGFLGYAREREEGDDTDGEGEGDGGMQRHSGRGRQRQRPTGVACDTGAGSTTPPLGEKEAANTVADTQIRASTSNNSHNNTITTTTNSSSNHHLVFEDPPNKPPSSRKLGNNNDTNNPKSPPTYPMARAVSLPRDTTSLPASLPANRHDYAILLSDEIRRVTQHLKSHPPRSYTFTEWAWFLRLVGEDESSAETHRKPVPPRKKRRRRKKEEGEEEVVVDGGEGEKGGGDAERVLWSWVGSRSPLMGSQEEAEWILEKLEERLGVELRGLREDARGVGVG